MQSAESSEIVSIIKAHPGVYAFEELPVHQADGTMPVPEGGKCVRWQFPKCHPASTSAAERAVMKHQQKISHRIPAGFHCQSYYDAQISVCALPASLRPEWTKIFHGYIPDHS